MAKRRKTSLAVALRKLWRDEDLMDRFSRGKAGRKEVAQQLNLSAEHSRILTDGCVQDVVHALAGAKPKAMNSTVVSSIDSTEAAISCGHAECEAFALAIGQRKPSKKR